MLCCLCMWHVKQHGKDKYNCVVITAAISTVQDHARPYRRKQGFFGGCPLYLCLEWQVSSTMLPVSAVHGPFLASTRCGFSHFKWELKEVMIAGCFSCFFFFFLKACKVSICHICPCKELECYGRMAARYLRASLNACCNASLCQSFICCTDVSAGSHLVVNVP